MGYSIHITRKASASDPDGPQISLQEWVSWVERDPSLQWEPELGEHFAVFADPSEADPSWLVWDRGSLESKHPSRAMIAKMHAMADSLAARLIGEEGEGYDRFGDEVPRSASIAPPEPVGILRRLRSIFGPRPAEDPGFAVGARVRDPLGRAAAVVRVDLATEGGLGCIVVRYDDGREARFAAEAHGLENLGAVGAPSDARCPGGA